ncbi:Gfo/Idh/MocA family protein [Leptospira interrogans]
MTKLGISIVGLGMAVEPHAKSLLDLKDRVDVCWAASPSQTRIEKFASRYPFPVTTDVDRAITDPAVDAVILLTPPGTHRDVGKQCLENGKHVLVEKPLEFDVQRATDLVETAERTQRTLGVVFQHRFRKSTRRAAALIAEGRLGSIEAAMANIPWWRPQSYYDEPGRGTMARDGGGVLITQAIHTIDVFRSLVGGVRGVVSAQAVTTSVHRMECEDFVSALVRLGNGAPGTIMATTAAYPGRPEQIDIIGTRGVLSIKGDTLSFKGIDGESVEENFATDTGSGADPMAFSHEAHRDLIADFVEAATTGRSPVSSGREALATQVLLEGILSAARSSKETALPRV